MDITYRPAKPEDLEEAECNGAADRALITPAYNIASTGLYLKWNPPSSAKRSMNRMIASWIGVF